VDSTTGPTPPRQDLERFEKLAKDTLIAHESGDPAALQTIHEEFGHLLTWEELREGLRRRRTEILGKDPGTSYLNLDDVRLILARQKGFRDWAALVKAVSEGSWVS
jgi:hypothetical protein